MEREFRCPSCGAGNVVTNPGIVMKVCDYCKTAIYWDKESALRAGRKSVDLPPATRFRVGGTGKIKGRPFRVLGRLHYAHQKGTWDEWFIEMDGGGILWLAEDEGELFVESSLNLTSPVPAFEDLRPGMQIALNQDAAVVEELGEARCLGGEGEIPFPVELGETYPYADGTAADGSFVFGLEYDNEGGEPSAFKGKLVAKRETRGEENREAAASRVGEIIRCPSCGSAYEGKRVSTTEMVACESCGSTLKLDAAEARVVGQNTGPVPYFTLQVGTSVTLDGVTYEVMGRLYYVEVDEGLEYPSYEYVLYHPDHGYIWLSEENGHFTTSRPHHLRVNFPDYFSPRRGVKVGGETYLTYEQGTVTLRYVDGAIPWVASVGETTEYACLTKPPEYIEREITGNEYELFKGRYIANEEMRRAVPEGVHLRQPQGAYFCQPYRRTAYGRGLMLVGAAFLAVNVVLLLYSLFSSGGVVLVDTVPADRYTQEYITEPFEVTERNTVLSLEGEAPLNNSWVALDFALVNTDDSVIGEFSGEASFYHGRDSEGYWTEGSKSFTSYFRVEKPGSYRLLLHGTGGSGYSGPARKETISIRVRQGATISYYFVFPLILAALVAFWSLIRKYTFEAKRWAPVMEDEDD